MFNWLRFNSIRAAWVALLGLTIALSAQAQFRIPNLPKGPNIPGPKIPNFGGGNTQQPNTQDLLESGRNLAEVSDLDNPDRQEDLGQSIALAISNRYPVTRNRALNEYVNMVGLTVASVSPRPDLHYAFGVLETREVNAFSTPGGYVFITRGALDLCNDECELAGVLAHEVAHVVANDGIKAVKDAKFRQAADPFVKTYGQKFGAFAKYADEGATFVLVKGYNQEQERLADSKAIEYLILANYDPRGFARFLARMNEQSAGNRGSKLMSTHPGTAERIGSVTRQIASYKSIAGVRLQERFEKNAPAPGK